MRKWLSFVLFFAVSFAMPLAAQEKPLNIRPPKLEEQTNSVQEIFVIVHQKNKTSYKSLRGSRQFIAGAF